MKFRRRTKGVLVQPPFNLVRHPPVREKKRLRPVFSSSTRCSSPPIGLGLFSNRRPNPCGIRARELPQFLRAPACSRRNLPRQVGAETGTPKSPRANSPCQGIHEMPPMAPVCEPHEPPCHRRGMAAKFPDEVRLPPSHRTCSTNGSMPNGPDCGISALPDGPQRHGKKRPNWYKHDVQVGCSYRAPISHAAPIADFFFPLFSNKPRTVGRSRWAPLWANVRFPTNGNRCIASIRPDRAHAHAWWRTRSGRSILPAISRAPPEPRFANRRRELCPQKCAATPYPTNIPGFRL